jgi:hypothetical protein
MRMQVSISSFLFDRKPDWSVNVLAFSGLGAAQPALRFYANSSAARSAATAATILWCLPIRLPPSTGSGLQMVQDVVDELGQGRWEPRIARRRHGFSGHEEECRRYGNQDSPSKRCKPRDRERDPNDTRNKSNHAGYLMLVNASTTRKESDEGAAGHANCDGTKKHG